MSRHSDQANADFERLVWLVLDERADEADFARLDQLLHGNAELQQQYLSLCDQHFECQRLALSGEEHNIAEKPGVDRVERPHPIARLGRRGYEIISNYLALSLLISGLFMTIILLSMALWIVPEGKPDAPQVADAPITEFVARIIAAEGVTFDETSGGNLRNRDLFADDTIVLESGLVVVEYDSGAIIVLEGPVTYQLAGRNGGELRLGRLVGRAETAASHGFAIDLPGATIVDLGTEFAAEVSEAGDAEVTVLSGLVELTGVAGSRQPVRLAAMEAASVDASGATVIKHNQVQPDALMALANLRGQLKSTDEAAVEAKMGLLFAESFERPTVVGYAENTLPESGWVGSTEGYQATSHGLIHEGDGATFSTPFGEQAYLLGYTNTGLTTSENAIPEVLTPGVTYTVTCHVAVKQGEPSGNYLVELVAFEPGANRAEARAERPGTVLASATGEVSTSDMSKAVEFQFTATRGNRSLWKPLGIRLIKGKSKTAEIYDNVKLTASRGVAVSKSSQANP